MFDRVPPITMIGELFQELAHNGAAAAGRLGRFLPGGEDRRRALCAFPRIPRRHTIPIACLVPVLCALAATGCGYHVAGHADLLPKTIRTVSVTPFGNGTTRARLPQALASAFSREFITRTRYQVTGDPSTADAILEGVIHSLVAFPTVFDPVTGRSTGVQMSVVLQVQLRNRATGELLFFRPNMEVRERYEISIDQFAYFEESGTALDRWSRDVARSVVSAILEKF